LDYLALTRLKGEKEQVEQQLVVEKDNLLAFERELDELRAQSDYLQGVIQEKEEAVSEFDRMIAESEKYYTQIVAKSAELRQVLESEAANLRMRTKPGANKKPEAKEEEGADEEAEEEQNDEDDD
jgi:SMC interacting uncharacterized protein involved in chromosome segregation